MSASNYKREQKADVAIGVGATVSVVYQLPMNRGKGGISLWLKVATAGSPTLSVTFQPAFANPQTDTGGAPLVSGAYLLPGSATAKSARIYKGAAGFAAFTALAVTDGSIYMVEIDMVTDGMMWDSVQLNFTGATAALTLTPFIAND